MQDHGGVSARRRGAQGSVVVLIVFAVLFAVETLGWAAAVLRNPFGPDGLAAEILYLGGEAAAVLAPAAWYLATVWLARTTQSRDIVLIVGLVLLVPWPFVIGAV